MSAPFYGARCVFKYYSSRKISLFAKVFIARQHAYMHAERDIVMTNPSVGPSVCPSHSGIVSGRMHAS